MVKTQAPLSSIPFLVFDETLFISKRSLFIFRAICLSLYLVAFAFNSYIDGFFDSFKFLTSWGMHFVGVYTAIVVIGYFKKLNKGWKRFANILFETAFAYQLLITAFFWVFIYPHLKAKYENNLPEWINTLYLHGFCLFQVYYEYCFNTILIKAKDFYYLVSIGCIYMVLNYLYTINIEPVYPVMTFKDNVTYIYIVVAITAVIIHFLYGALIGRLFKKKQVVELENRMMKTLKF